MHKTCLYAIISIAVYGCALQSDSLPIENEKSKKVVCKNEAGMTRCSKVELDKSKE